MPKLCLGKLPARIDNRVPRMSIVSQGRLPEPPKEYSWYEDVDEWGMLSNDTLGCCVPAAILHIILQMSSYAGRPMVPTVDEVRELYKVAGWNPDDPTTDQGSYVLGQQGLIPAWMKNGVMCGGRLNKVSGFMQIIHKDPVEWCQGIWLFGGMLVGLQLPEVIMAADEVPYVWRDHSGQVAGGHEILVNGYADYDGERLYDLVSWGARYRATEEFLLNCVDETVVVINTAALNTQGLDGAGLSLAQLTASMHRLA